MGEEEKKPPAEEKKKQEVKKEEADEKPQEKPAEEKKLAPEESKEAKEEQTSIVLKVHMHCEGCARKVRRFLKGFEGVEDVITDCETQKVIVKGEKADPLKVLDRVQRKSHRQVELLSPIPKPPAKEQKKTEEKEQPKPEEKKEEPQVISVVLKVHMHCEACSLEIKKRILRMKGVEEAEPDLKSSQVTVKGVFDPPKLVDYVYKRTRKHAVIVKQEPEKKEEKGNDGAAVEEKKGGGGGGGGGDNKENKTTGEEENKEKKEGDNNKSDSEAKPEAAAAIEEKKVVEIKKHEYYYYPPKYSMDLYGYPPQIFSDENPNACSVM